MRLQKTKQKKCQKVEKMKPGLDGADSLSHDSPFLALLVLYIQICLQENTCVKVIQKQYGFKTNKTVKLLNNTKL